MKMYYFGNKAEIEVIINKINANCGFGAGNSTITWAEPVKVQGGYVCEVPEGSHGFSKEEMLVGVAGNIIDNPIFVEEGYEDTK